MKLASKMRQYIYTLSVISSFIKFCVARTFFVERHLDAVLERLQVVESKFLYFFIKNLEIFTKERFNKKISMVALLMTEIFNFTTIEEKNEF